MSTFRSSQVVKPSQGPLKDVGLITRDQLDGHTKELQYFGPLFLIVAENTTKIFPFSITESYVPTFC